MQNECITKQNGHFLEERNELLVAKYEMQNDKQL